MSTGKTALTAVQVAVMATLANDGGLKTLVPGGVWDYVPADPTWPFICLDSADEVPEDRYGRQGRAVTLVLTVFSNYQGRSQQFDVVDAIIRLLRHADLTITGWKHLATWHLATRATSPFEQGNQRAGMSSVTMQVVVQET